MPAIETVAEDDLPEDARRQLLRLRRAPRRGTWRSILALGGGRGVTATVLILAGSLISGADGDVDQLGTVIGRLAAASTGLKRRFKTDYETTGTMIETDLMNSEAELDLACSITRMDLAGGRPRQFPLHELVRVPARWP